MPKGDLIFSSYFLDNCKLFRTTGQTSDLLVDSQSIEAVTNYGPNCCVWDGTNTYFIGHNGDGDWRIGGITGRFNDDDFILDLPIGTVDFPWDLEAVNENNTIVLDYSYSKLFLFEGRVTSTIIDSILLSSIDAMTGVTSDTIDTIVTGDIWHKLYKLAGIFSSTLIISCDLVSFAAYGVSYDGDDFIYIGSLEDKVYAQPNDFTSVVSHSLQVNSFDYPHSVSTAEAESRALIESEPPPETRLVTLIANDEGTLLVLDGQFTSTVLDSLASGYDIYGIDWDGENTYLSTSIGLRTLLGQFTSTIRASLEVGAANGVAFDGVNLIYSDTDKIFKLDGSYSTTIIDSVPKSAVNIGNYSGIAAGKNNKLYCADDETNLYKLTDWGVDTYFSRYYPRLVQHNNHSGFPIGIDYTPLYVFCPDYDIENGRGNVATPFMVNGVVLTWLELQQYIRSYNVNDNCAMVALTKETGNYTGLLSQVWYANEIWNFILVGTFQSLLSGYQVTIPGINQLANANGHVFVPIHWQLPNTNYVIFNEVVGDQEGYPYRLNYEHWFGSGLHLIPEHMTRIYDIESVELEYGTFDLAIDSNVSHAIGDLLYLTQGPLSSTILTSLETVWTLRGVATGLLDRLGIINREVESTIEFTQTIEYTISRPDLIYATTGKYLYRLAGWSSTILDSRLFTEKIDGASFDGQYLIYITDTGKIKCQELPFSSTVLDSIDLGASGRQSVTIQDEDIWVHVGIDSKVFKFQGRFSTTVLDSFTPAETAIYALESCVPDIMVAYDDRIVNIDYTTHSVLDTFTPSSALIKGLAYDGKNTVWLDANTDKLYLQYGRITSTVLDSATHILSGRVGNSVGSLTTRRRLVRAFSLTSEIEFHQHIPSTRSFSLESLLYFSSSITEAQLIELSQEITSLISFTQDIVKNIKSGLANTSFGFDQQLDAKQHVRHVSASSEIVFIDIYDLDYTPESSPKSEITFNSYVYGNIIKSDEDGGSGREITFESHIDNKLSALPYRIKVETKFDFESSVRAASHLEYPLETGIEFTQEFFLFNLSVPISTDLSFEQEFHIQHISQKYELITDIDFVSESKGIIVASAITEISFYSDAYRFLGYIPEECSSNVTFTQTVAINRVSSISASNSLVYLHDLRGVWNPDDPASVHVVPSDIEIEPETEFSFTEEDIDVGDWFDDSEIVFEQIEEHDTSKYVLQTVGFTQTVEVGKILNIELESSITFNYKNLGFLWGKFINDYHPWGAFS